MRRKRWNAHPLDVRAVAELSVAARVSPLLAQMLLNRGVRTWEEADAFLHPSAAHLHDPMLLPDMPAAVARLRAALDSGERIVLYGDYDVDGTTGVALLLGVLRSLGADVDFYIPDRLGEGYGINSAAIHAIRRDGADLLVTLDCGITAREPLAEAHRLGLDVIVTDHHSVDPERVPGADTVVALVDPKREGHDYPYRELAGVGLAWKLAHAVTGGSADDPHSLLHAQLDLVALGTIADIAELRGENRALAALGMGVLARRERIGVRALCEVAGLAPEVRLTSYHVSFVLGPRINAAGRLDTAHKVVELLTTDSPTHAHDIARRLHQENDARRDLQRRTLDEAQQRIEEDRELDRERAIVVAREGWHPGVVGLVAQRLTERYGRPTIVIALEGERGKGSGRSIPAFDLHAGLLECRNWMVTFGGHAAAAGLTVETSAVKGLRKAFLEVARARLRPEDLVPEITLEAVLPLDELRLDTVQELALLEPFGDGNPSPRVGVRGLHLAGPPALMGEEHQHLQATVTDGQSRVRVVSWYGAEYAVPLKTPDIEVDVAGRVEVNDYRQQRSVQIVADDWVIHAAASDGVFPRREHAAWVRIVDRRCEPDKGAYLEGVLSGGDMALVYVRDDHALDQASRLLEQFPSIGPRGACAGASTVEEQRSCVRRFLSGEWKALVAVPTVTAFAAPTEWRALRHIVFGHPPPDEETFLERCAPALYRWEEGEPREEDGCLLHLLFNARDIEVHTRRIHALHPDDEALRRVFRAAPQKDDPITVEEWRVALDEADRPLLDTALTVFEELGLLRPTNSPRGPAVQQVATGRRNLADSPTFRCHQVERRRWEIQARLWGKRTARDFWEILTRYRCDLLCRA
jgi:single-stranded-DNA-specific exonuclease